MACADGDGADIGPYAPALLPRYKRRAGSVEYTRQLGDDGSNAVRGGGRPASGEVVHRQSRARASVLINPAGTRRAEAIRLCISVFVLYHGLDHSHAGNALAALTTVISPHRQRGRTCLERPSVLRWAHPCALLEDPLEVKLAHAHLCRQLLQLGHTLVPEDSRHEHRLRLVHRL